MKKIYLLIFILTIGFYTQAQIAISEVYYDTPVIERYESANPKKFAGEFVELFNYSTEDIDVSRWRLSDNTSSYLIPEGTIIPSGDYLIIAKEIPNTNNSIPDWNDDYFFKLFPNEQSGNEEKVKYQNAYLLNNFEDYITLSTNRFQGKRLRTYGEIFKVSWDCRNNYPCDRNPKNNSAINQGEFNSNFNFYKKSLQVKSNQSLERAELYANNNNSFTTATPFGLTFNPELKELNEIANLNTILYDNYPYFTWDQDVRDLINNSCDNTVTVVSEQSVSDVVVQEHCFNFDTAGNQESNHLCSNSSGNNDPVTIDDLDEIANKIQVAPNPTNGLTTISWDVSIKNFLNQIKVVAFSGAFEIPVTFNANTLSANFNISSRPSGLYVVKIRLTSGEYVNKTIIKI